MKIMAYASRLLQDFNKYEALEMLESLQVTAQDTKHDRQNFYRLVYQTVRESSMCLGINLEVFSCAFWAMKIMKKSLIVWRR